MSTRPTVSCELLERRVDASSWDGDEASLLGVAEDLC